MTTRIRLIGAKRYCYGLKGEIFEKLDEKGRPIEYDLDDAKAEKLLALTTDQDMPYFTLCKARKATAEVIEETEVESAEVEGVKITRTRRPAKTSSRVKKSGELKSLLDADDELKALSKTATDDEDEEGVDV